LTSLTGVTSIQNIFARQQDGIRFSGSSTKRSAFSDVPLYKL